ncbi:MAG: EamA family transporter [Devosia sp.]|nr:EamA family transporter [Devosia sp.]
MPRSNPMLGIGFKIASVLAFLIMSSLIKAVPGIPPGQLVFFRSAFAILPIVVFLAYSGELRSGFRTTRPLGHLWRGLIGVCGMSSAFFALTRLPLPEAISIGYGTPLLVVVFGAVFLKENVRLYRWLAVAIGLLGIGIIMWPRLSVFGVGGASSELTIGAIAALLSCVFGAFAMIQIRNLVRTERSATIVIYFSIACTIMALFSIPFGWVTPTPFQFAMLAGAGIIGGLGQISLTESYRHAEVSMVAPFDYSSLIFSIIIGYLFFADVPTPQMLIGAVIVVGAGLFIIFREHQLGVVRRKAAEVSPPAN